MLTLYRYRQQQDHSVESSHSSQYVAVETIVDYAENFAEGIDDDRALISLGYHEEWRGVSLNLRIRLMDS